MNGLRFRVRCLPLLVGLLLINVVGVAAQAQPPSRMVSYWRFDEGSGLTTFDSVNGNHGTIYGAIWTTGKVYGALYFDGVDDYVEVSDSASLDITDKITIEAWIFPVSDVYPWVGPPRIVSKGGEGPKIGYELTWDWANKFGFILWQPDRPLFSPESYSKDQWYHVVGTFDGSIQKLYVNGDLVNQVSVNPSIPINDFNLFIGRAEGGYGWPFNPYFNGIIDEVAIYNRALASEEIQQHYQNGLEGKGYFVEIIPTVPEISFSIPIITSVSAALYLLIKQRLSNRKE